jgi:hypothetical protein
MRLGIRVYPQGIEKAHKDFSKLTPKVIIDKNGHTKTIYVRMGLPIKENIMTGTGNKVAGERVTLTESDMEKQLSNAELKKECFEYARKNFQGNKLTNRETGREIIISKDGLGEWKSKSKSREQILSIKILDKLLENSTFDHDVPDKYGRKNIENISYFKGKCVINGTEYSAVITIRRIKNYGDKYYHHYLEDIKIEPYSGITRPADEPG